MTQRRPFSAWLYTVAANHCWDLLRRRKLRQDLETGEVENMPLEHPDPGQLEQLVQQRTSQEIRSAMDKLPSRSRMALVLRYYSDMSYDDIATTLGVRRTFVGVVLLRARHQLREILENIAEREPRNRRRGMIHFDEMACLLYLEGQLDPQRAQELETHVEDCAACRNLLHALQSETTLLSSALTEDNEPVPARILGERTRQLPIMDLDVGIWRFCSIFLLGLGRWTQPVSSIL